MVSTAMDPAAAYVAGESNAIMKSQEAVKVQISVNRAGNLTSLSI